MTNCDDVDEGDSTYATTTVAEDIHYIETTNEWATGRFAKTFIDVVSNEPRGYEGFDMPNGNEEFPPVYNQGLTCRKTMHAHHDLLELQRVGLNRMDPRGRGEASKRWMLKAYT
ncbi:retrotransposon protein [Cucumis melo var. makuwa]|uniref:Retrotransposon protein n=1 Tax=Cucumis melo var. makuwa TaxID=1194695 RepID=A0A5A7UV54_CUCMM|nr:retrotransposon protein [Cucumis melo var. makuwa]TYK10977.1 retrotransposon protein [Cucumis melo var. makuwa]